MLLAIPLIWNQFRDFYYLLSPEAFRTSLEKAHLNFYEIKMLNLTLLWIFETTLNIA